MPDIQRRYEEQLKRLTALERVERMAAMFHWTREVIGRQIQQESGVSNVERLRWEVAMRQYGADPRMRILIERMLNRVPD